MAALTGGRFYSRQDISAVVKQIGEDGPEATRVYPIAEPMLGTINGIASI